MAVGGQLRTRTSRAPGGARIALKRDISLNQRTPDDHRGSGAAHAEATPPTARAAQKPPRHLHHHVTALYVGAAAVAARLAPAWQPLFARQYHEIVLVEFAESRQRQPGEKRPEPPPPEHHFKLVAERVDRSQWGQWKKAVDAECASSGVQRNIGQMAKLCMEKAAEHLKPTLPGLPSAPTTRGFQRDLRDAQQACKRLRAAARGSEDPDEYARARALRTQAQRRLNAACSRRERVRVRICYLMLERGRRRNPRAFWAQLREVLGAGRRRGSASKIRVELRAEDGSLTSNPDELVRLWTALFSRIGDKPAGCFEPQRVYYEIAASIIVENLDYSAEPAVQNGDIPMLEMAQCMLRVTLGKSHDPQHVYGDIWHKLAVRFFDDEGVLRMHEYGPAMAMLLDAVNAVWRGDVKSDDDERIQRIVPVLKSVKLDPTLEGSYRDVTVTSRVSALTDVIAKQRLMRVLEGHGKVPARMDSAQHGFRPGRSCDTALFTVMSLIQRAMLTGKQLLIVFWDCRKCYPTTWRERLIVKLAELGITGRLLNYLVHCGALDYERFVDVPGMTERVLFKDKRGLSTGHILSPPLCNVEQDGIDDYFDHQDFAGLGVVLGLLAGQTKITTVRFADDGAGFAESVAGMHRLLMGLDAYFEDCQRQFNVEAKETQLMAFNVPAALLRAAQFKLSGHVLPIVDSFRYLGTMLSSKMSFKVPQRLPSIGGDVWVLHQWARVNKAMGPLNAALYSRGEVSMRALRQLITILFNAAEYGSGVMICQVWKAFDKLVRDVATRALGLFNTPGIPMEFLLGELGLWTSEARFAMHTLRVWSAIMVMPDTERPRRAWAALVAECNERHNPPNTLVARVRQVLRWINREDCFDNGLPQPGGADDAPTHKELIHAWASQQWRQRIEATYLRHHYSMVATQKIAYVEVYEHMSLEVKMVDTRCRGEIWCGRSREGRKEGIPREERVCLLCGNDVETVSHYYGSCPHWAALRAAVQAAVRECRYISGWFTERIGTFETNRAAWVRMLLGAPFEEALGLGAEYNVPTARLRFLITSYAFDRSVSEEDVQRARRALRDRKWILRVTGPIKVQWYRERAALGGFTSIL